VDRVFPAQALEERPEGVAYEAILSADVDLVELCRIGFRAGGFECAYCPVGHGFSPHLAELWPADTEPAVPPSDSCVIFIGLASGAGHERT
jgi:hypothetical protein